MGAGVAADHIILLVFTIEYRAVPVGAALLEYLVIHAPLDHFKLVPEHKLADVFFGTVR